jgi:hypothetical protein
MTTMTTGPTASIATGYFSDEEQSQLRLMIKKFTINYKPATGKEIVFSPSMLELGETEYAVGSTTGINGANSSNSSSSSTSSSIGSTRLKQSVRSDRSVVYLPDTHKIRPIFMKYYKQYSPTIGNPALVFIDKATFLDYMKYATKLIADEQKKAAAAAAASPPVSPPPQSSFVDSNKERQLNDNIKFVIETIFSKNRVLAVGGDFKVQVTVGGRKVLLNQEYYIESLPTILDKSTPTTTVPIYASADSEVIDLEGKADKKREDIDNKEQVRKTQEANLETAQKDLNTAKDALRAAIKATTPVGGVTPNQPTLEKNIRDANDKLLEVRTAYKKAREEEKIAISDRAAILNKINQFKYGHENSKITEILSKISALKREKAAKELEIGKINLSKTKIDDEIAKKTTDIEETKKKLTTEINNAAKIYGIGITDTTKTNDTILSEISAEYAANVVRIKTIQSAGRKDAEEKAELDKKLLQNSQYDIIANMIKKLMATLKVDKEMVDIGSSSSNNLLTKRKVVETNLTALEVDKTKKAKEIEKLNLSLYDYTLRVYMFDMPPLSLISKYLENGKENPQFVSMHKKFYKSVEADELALSRVGSRQTFLSTVNCAKDRNEIRKMYDNIMGSAKRTVEDAIDGIGIQDGGAGGAMDKIKAALMHPADDPPIYEDPDSGGWIAKILKKPGEDDTSKYVSMVGMGKYPLYFTLFDLYRMHKPTVDPPSEDKIDVACESPPPPPERHSVIRVRNLNLLLSDDQPVPDMFPPQASDMLEYSKRIKDVRIPYENYNFNVSN